MFLGIDILYWISKLMTTSSPFFYAIHNTINANFGLFSIIEFLGVISIFVDTIVRLDEFQKEGTSKIRLTIMVTVGSSFLLQLIVAFMELFVSGGIN
jgi:hypothetical protein